MRINRIPTDNEFNYYHTQHGCEHLLWMECASSLRILQRWKTLCCRNCSKLLIMKLLENLGAETYNSWCSHCYNGRMYSILWAFAFLRFFRSASCWRIVLGPSLQYLLRGWTAVAGFSDILDTLCFGTLGDQTVVWYVAKSLECACISSAHMHHRVSVLVCVCLSHPMLALQPMMQFQSNTNSFSATIAPKLNKRRR